MTAAQETVRLIESLPPEKAEVVLQFARFLAEHEAEEAWERSIQRAADSPKFKALLADVERDIAEGKATPMDFDQL